ncbi:2754_t:CDS:2 [Dentiscutata erythropus]|uniref:2754_t:CDS:1 n=1 Tax=Dentiscutata erythropus TaxID=1348616 RepID=A0A9N9D7Z9_9GLOM|nr:2754_t:CDS:2 [Dentiscutata erythropus]
MLHESLNNKIVFPFISVPSGVPPVIFLEEESDESKNDSDANNIINKARRWLKLNKEKNKLTIVQCLYDLASNAYLQESPIRFDSRNYISKRTIEKEETEIRDLFDYYYREELNKKNTYQIEELDLD